MMSMPIPFSASTMRVRWLHRSLGAENRVMMDRRLDKGLTPYPHVPGWPSVDVLPVLPLEQVSQRGKGQQEQYHPDAQGAALNLARVTDVVQEIDQIPNRRKILLVRLAARGNLHEMIEHRLLVHRLEHRHLDAFQGVLFKGNAATGKLK